VTGVGQCNDYQPANDRIVVDDKNALGFLEIHGISKRICNAAGVKKGFYRNPLHGIGQSRQR